MNDELSRAVLQFYSGNVLEMSGGGSTPPSNNLGWWGLIAGENSDDQRTSLPSLSSEFPIREMTTTELNRVNDAFPSSAAEVEGSGPLSTIFHVVFGFIC